MKKIVVLGPESTGKSTLCEQLAAHFNTLWVREYAREFLLKNGTQYQFEQLYEIASGQLREEDIATKKLESSSSTAPLIIDTDLYVIKIWSEIVFNQCDNRILNSIVQRKYDLYLLCNTDLPWAPDELREYPDLKTRQKIFHFYKDAMLNQQTPWVEINGNYTQRFQTAKAAIEAIL